MTSTSSSESPIPTLNSPVTDEVVPVPNESKWLVRVLWDVMRMMGEYCEGDVRVL